MASKTGICNLALSHLGVGKEIANLETERSEEAAACRRFYDQTLEQVLRDFTWPFATKIATLNLIEEDPNEDWQFSYRYPTDCLMVRRVLNGTRNPSRQEREPYRISQDSAGRLIYSDREDAELEYTVTANDPALYPPDFSMAFSFRLAAYIAPRVTGGDPFKMGDRALKLYEIELGMAKSNSVNEEQDEELPNSEFIAARD